MGRSLISVTVAGACFWFFRNQSAAIFSAYSNCSIDMLLLMLLLVRDICALAIKHHLYASRTSVGLVVRIRYIWESTSWAMGEPCSAAFWHSVSMDSSCRLPSTQFFKK